MDPKANPLDLVTREIKLEIISKEVQLWRNTLYQATVRARVGKSAANKEYEAAALKDAETATRMLDALETELANI